MLLRRVCIVYVTMSNVPPFQMLVSCFHGKQLCLTDIAGSFFQAMLRVKFSRTFDFLLRDGVATDTHWSMF